MTEFFPPPPVPPATLTASFVFSPTGPDKGSRVNFTASATGGTQPYDYRWSFGDGNRSVGRAVEYVYLTPGNFTVGLTVTDKAGQEAVASQNISIDRDPKPTAASPGQTTMIFPRTLGLMISFAIGVALPLALSFVVSRRHRKTERSTQVGGKDWENVKKVVRMGG